jgi:hypothetical protein
MSMENHGGMILGKSWLATRVLCQSYKQRHLVASRRNGRKEWEFCLAKYFCSYLQVIFTCRKILRHGAPDCHPPRCLFLSRLKAIACVGFESAKHGSNENIKPLHNRCEVPGRWRRQLSPKSWKPLWRIHNEIMQVFIRISITVKNLDLVSTSLCLSVNLAH